VLYSDDSFMAAFHDSLGSSNVCASRWEGGMRLITFELQLRRAPAVITSVLGAQLQHCSILTISCLPLDVAALAHHDD
jgi:hypothetical protein